MPRLLTRDLGSKIHWNTTKNTFTPSRRLLSGYGVRDDYKHSKSAHLQIFHLVSTPGLELVLVDDLLTPWTLSIPTLLLQLFRLSLKALGQKIKSICGPLWEEEIRFVSRHAG